MRLKSILREPLVHFLAIGAALFLFFAWRGGGSGPGSNRIVLASGQVDHLAASFTKVWQRPPTEAELKGLVDDWVKEEIAVREAMTAGLDRDDTIIRRRLRQKLEFVVEDFGAAPPAEKELQEWLEKHADAFRIEPRVAFRQVYVSPSKRRTSAEADARAILARLRAASEKAPIDDLGDPIMLPQEVELVPQGEVARIFGSDFATRIEKIAPGIWTGPVESGFGLHLVLVRERVGGSAANLASVRPAVEREFMAERRKQQLATMYERLLAKYKVVIERPDLGRAASGKAKAGS